MANTHPKWKYHRTQPACIVQDEIEEVNLGPGWVDHPDLLTDEPEEALEDDAPVATFIQAAEPEDDPGPEPESGPGEPAAKPAPKPKAKAKAKAKQQSKVAPAAQPEPEPQPE